VADTTIEVEHLGKRYARDLRRSQRYGMTAILGELRPRREVGRELRSSEFWALREVSFSVVEGEALGVIGRNGAGKSTLLRLIAGIIRPDEGRVVPHRRVSALLDPSSSFDPILTGRENLDVAYALMAGEAPDRRTAERIIEYAELGAVIDTPVRTFSKGMRLRLGFSVMVHADPAVLLIDEALAVGDTAFQLRCLEQLRTFCREGGSLIFVSHSLWLFQHLATRGIHLSGGRIAFEGRAHEVVDRYLDELRSGTWADAQGGPDPLDRELVLPAATPKGPAAADGEGEETPPVGAPQDRPPERPVSMDAVSVLAPDGTVVTSDGPAVMAFELRSRERFDSAELAITVWTADLALCLIGDLSVDVLGGNRDGSFELPPGTTTVRYSVDRFSLAPGRYVVRAAVYELPTNDILCLHGFEDAPTWFEVAGDRGVEVSAAGSGAGQRPLRSIDTDGWETTLA
jgi:lipopolysaccharide transport system ATP-binding protein